MQNGFWFVPLSVRIQKIVWPWRFVFLTDMKSVQQSYLSTTARGVCSGLVSRDLRGTVPTGQETLQERNFLRYLSVQGRWNFALSVCSAQFPQRYSNAVPDVICVAKRRGRITLRTTCLCILRRCSSLSDCSFRTEILLGGLSVFVHRACPAQRVAHRGR